VSKGRSGLLLLVPLQPDTRRVADQQTRTQARCNNCVNSLGSGWSASTQTSCPGKDSLVRQARAYGCHRCGECSIFIWGGNFSELLAGFLGTRAGLDLSHQILTIFGWEPDVCRVSDEPQKV